MRGWTDLSWREKCKIEAGEISPFDYLTGYSFDVKTKAREGTEQKENNKKIIGNNSK